jgi:FkbM family methyltransferase
MRLQSAAMAHEIVRGDHDEKEMALLPWLVLPGETAIDIGSNYAMVSYHLSRAGGPSGTVHAFEPIPFPFEVSRMIAAELGIKNVVFHQMGCGEVNQILGFTVPIQRGGAISAGQSHLATRENAHPGRERHFRFDQWKVVECQVVRLDDVFDQLPGLSFIKADIEGAELFAFRGAQRLIETYRPSILCEINPFFLKGFKIELDDLLGFFTSRRYTVHSYRDAPEPCLMAARAADIVEGNYLFIPEERLPRLAGLAIGPKG